MNKYVILSTDSNPDYWRLLPLVCYSWKKIGYTPVIYAFGCDEKTLVTLAKYAGGVIKYNSYEGVKDSTMAQLIRLFANPANADDILITGDADMVMAKDIFTHEGEVVSYGYDLTGRSELPICYVKATAAKWRELMGDLVIPIKAYSEKWEDYWSVDQQLLTQRAKEFGMNRITFVDRGNGGPGGLPTGRWDRHGWIKPAEIIDVHMKRNDWNAQYEVFKALWPNDDMQFLIDFKNECESDALAAAGEQIEKGSFPNGIHGELSFADEFEFLNISGNWDNHRGMLLLGLSLTEGEVVELGAGDGSTPFLRKYCEAHNREFNSYDSSQEWAGKHGSIWTHTNWDGVNLEREIGLLFVDHAPGERRKIDIARAAASAKIIVIHDTEEGGAGDYKLNTIWPLFKYRLNHNRKGGGAGASMVSNTIDVTKFRGLSLGNYKFDND